MKFTGWNKDQVSEYIKTLEHRMRGIRDLHCFDAHGVQYKSDKARLLHDYLESRLDEALSHFLTFKAENSPSVGVYHSFHARRPLVADNAQNGVKKEYVMYGYK